jgi:release factor glutamine methyltransferase
MPDPLVDRLRRAGCVFAEDEAAMLREAAGDDPRRLEALVRRREGGEPLEVVVGWAEFCGLRIAVDPQVFVPRRRTELVARTAVGLLADRPATGRVVLDLCCGSGAVAAVLASAYAGLEVHAADVDPAAVACARRNLAPPAQVHEGDLDAALPPDLRGRIDLVAANAPYVPTDELEHLPRESREHEPVVSVDGGPDGVALHRRIAVVAASWLRPGGVLVLETSPASLTRTLEAVSAAGLEVRTVADDDLDAVVVVATRLSLQADGAVSGERLSPAR